MANPESGASYFVAGGTLSSDTRSYIERDVDRALFDSLLAGKFCYVLNSRQMGKSSLCVRTQLRLKKQGVRSAFVDLSRIGSRNIGPEQWYAGVAVEIGRSLGLSAEILAYWKANVHLGPLQRLFSSLREVVLEGVPDSFVVMVDEIDATRSLPFDADEFFAAIRDCYNSRVHDKAYDRLTFCLIGAAVPSDLIKNPRITAFNIGERIHLRDFTLEEAQAFGPGLGDRSELVNRVHYWTGGQPFLTQSLCLAVTCDPAIRSRADVDAFVRRELLRPEARETNVNLADVGRRILNSPEEGEDLASYRSNVLSTYANILRGKGEVRDDESNHIIAVLKLSGLTRTEGKALRPRNPIYQQAFGLDWIRENMPGDEVRRQKAAYRQGLIRAGVAAVLVVIAVGSLAIAAIGQSRRADTNAAASKRHESDAVANAARANLNAVQALASEQRAEGLATQRDKATQTALAATVLERQARKSAEQQTALALEAKNQSLKNEALARTAERLANIRTVEARTSSRAAYQANLQVAARAIGDRSFGLATTILRSIRKSPDRDCAFDYLNRFADVGARTLGGHTGNVTNVRFTPDGAHILGSSDDGTIIEWGTSDSKLVQTFKGATGGIWCESISPNGKQLVSGGRDGSLAAYNLNTGKRTWSVSTPNIINWLCYSPHGGLLASCSGDGTVRLLEPGSGSPVSTFVLSRSQIGSACFSPDGKYLATGSNDGKLRFCEVPSGRVAGTISTKSSNLNSICFSPDGMEVASGGEVTEIWNTQSKALVRTFPVGPVNSVTCASDGRRWLTTNGNGTVTLWDDRTGSKLDEFDTGTKAQVLDGVFSPDGTLVATCNGWGVSVWPVRSQAGLVPIAPFGTQPIHDVGVSRDGARIVASSNDGEVRVLDGHTYKVLGSTKVASKYPTSTDISPDGRLLAVIDTAQEKALIYDVRSMRELTSVPGVTPVRFSPDSCIVLTGGRSGLIHGYDVRTGKQLVTFKGHFQAVGDIRFSPDCKEMLTTSEDGTARLWDPKTGYRLKTLQPGEGPIWAADYAPDGKTFALSDKYSHVTIYDRTGNLIRSMWAGGPGLDGIAFTPDSKVLVTAGTDGLLRFWDPRTGTQIFQVSQEAGPYRRVAMLRDGRIIVCGGKGSLLLANPFKDSDYRAIARREANEDETDKLQQVAASSRLAAASRSRKEQERNADLIAREAQAIAHRDWNEAVRLDTILIKAMPDRNQYELNRAWNALEAGQWDIAMSQARILAKRPGAIRDSGLAAAAYAAFHIGDKAVFNSVMSEYVDRDLTLDPINVLILSSLDPDAIQSRWAVIDQMVDERSSGAHLEMAMWLFSRRKYAECLSALGSYAKPRDFASFAGTDAWYRSSRCTYLYLAAGAEERLGNHSQAMTLVGSANAMYQWLKSKDNPVWLSRLHWMIMDHFRDEVRAMVQER